MCAVRVRKVALQSPRHVAALTRQQAALCSPSA